MAGLQPTNDRGRSRRNRNKPKMCRRNRDVLRRLRSVHPHSHTHTRALRSHTHIAPRRPKEQQSAHTFPSPRWKGGGGAARRQVGRQCKNRGGFVSVAERKRALVRPVQETETGSSKPCVCPRRESEAAWRGFVLDKTEIVVVQIRPRSVQISRKERESDMCERRRLFVSRCELSATEKRTAVPARRGVKAKQHRQELDMGRYFFFFNRRRRYGVSGFPCIVPSQPRPPPSPSSPCRKGERVRKESPAAVSRRRVVAVLSVRAGMRRRNSRRARTPAPRRERPGSRRAGASGRWLLRHHGAIAPH
ncbi:hypothetical protein MRX96_002723 [Rhipicephalus microplus]